MHGSRRFGTVRFRSNAKAAPRMATPGMPGKGHALAGIILGSLTFLANAAMVLLPALTR